MRQISHVIRCGLVAMFFHSGRLFAQETMDSPQTLEWVVRQANRVDTALANAMRSSEPIEILVKLADCYTVFDAVVISGLYCTEIRATAEMGRRQCDVINYRLEKDLNSKLQRAVEARRQAVLMRESASVCLKKTATAKIPEESLAPLRLLHDDAQLAQMDLADGLASNDLHILAQKVDHAIRLMYSIAHLSASMNACNQVSQWAEAAIQHSERALSTYNWTIVTQELNTAVSILEQIRLENRCE
ncbi:MAG TPA: hypothetical protein VK168_15990 [Saprospiraceae bacterium]|nr:hypothetical protein [Saprospiraceae bacterium]